MDNTAQHRVISVRELSESAYVLRMERNNFSFEPGQYIHAGPLSEMGQREYSVYSEPSADYLEVLIKEIPGGHISPKLRRLNAGDWVNVEGPFGFFCLEQPQSCRPFLFIATGTGISPFHCFIGSYPEINYTLVHGVRHSSEFYDHQHYQSSRLIRCVSREKAGDHHGRVSGWLKNHSVPDTAIVYICGGCDMIYEVYDILEAQGVSSDRIHAEVYF